MHQQIKSYLKYYRGESLLIFASIFFTLIQTATLIPIAILVQKLFDQVIPAGDIAKLKQSLLIIAILFIVNALMILANRHISLRVIKSIIGTIREQLIDNVLRLGKTYYAREDLDTIHSRIVTDTERVDCLTSALLTQFIPGLLISAGLGTLLLFLNPVLFAVLAFSLPLFYLFGRFVGKKMRKSIKKFHEDFSTFSKGVSFVLKFHDLIVLSSAEEKENARQKNNIQGLRFTSGRMAWISTAYTTIQGNILILGGIIILFVGGLGVIHGTETLGTLVSFYAATVLLASNIRLVTSSIPIMDEGWDSLRVLAPLLNEIDAKEDNKNKFNHLTNGIAFENVSFSFNEQKFRLEKINANFNKNKVTGIFGPSGSGKSTILNLLLGLYTPSTGKITVDKTSLDEIDLASYRKRIGVLSQDPGFFFGTIRENLTYGLTDLDEKELVRICSLVRINDFVQNLKDGFETMLGDRGVSISGGQRQRLAIARALLRKPDILILDEPDNNLDEEIIGEILSELKKESLTIIVVSHNKRLRPLMDSVLVINNGTITTEK